MNQKILLIAGILLLSAGAASATRVPDPRTGSVSADIRGKQLSVWHYETARGFLPATEVKPRTAKTTTGMSRLTGMSSYGFYSASSAFRIEDSSSLSYTGSRGGDLSSSVIDFDQHLGLTYNSSTSGMVNDWRESQSFDAHGNIGVRLMEQWSSGSWSNEERRFFTYDAAGHILIAAVLNWNSSTSFWDSSAKTINTYNAAGQLTSSTDLVFRSGSGTFENMWRLILTYDGSGNLTEETTQNWNNLTAAWVNDSRMMYTYAAGHMARLESQSWSILLGTWQDGYRSDYSYDGSGRVILELDQEYNLLSGLFQNAFRISFSYDVSGNLVADNTEAWDNLLALWNNHSRNVHEHDASGNVTATLTLEYDLLATDWDTTHRIDYTYNSYNQLTSSVSQTYGPHFTSADSRHNYYYQDIPTSVTAAAMQGNSLLMYPVPAANDLNLELELGIPQEFTVSITDMMGRIWMLWDEPSATRVSRNIHVGNLPNGNYYVQVYGKSGSRTGGRLLIAH